MVLFGDLLGALAGAPRGRNRRVSSNEQPNWNDGNFDMTPLQPGQILEMPILEGPGLINHIWLTSHAGGVNELNALSLRIYWDGAENPSRFGGRIPTLVRRYTASGWQTRKHVGKYHRHSTPPPLTLGLKA